MGASSSGLLDETKISQIKGLVESSLQRFSAFYQQQYAVAYFGHLHQEVEPKKEGRGLLLTHRPPYAPQEVLYQSSVKFSCWDEPGKKCRERYAILRRDYKVEIHDNMEAFNRGGAAKFILQPAGASVFTTEEESRGHVEKTCAGILNGVKEDSSSVVSPPDVFAVYLHLPYRSHVCFLFQQADDRDHFLSALKTCIRHRNLDPWCGSSYESQAFARALRLYRQDKGCYKSWEMLLGTEEQVLASQVMEEVLPWLQTQLQSRVKGKKSERIRQWLATVQATYSLVLEQLTVRLEALRGECRQTAAANQALIRSNLDQIVSSHCFLEQKVRDCVSEGAENVCSKFVAPYISSILEVLTEHVSSGIAGMRDALHARMDSTSSNTHGGGAEELQKALSSICLDQSYEQVEKLTEKLEDLKQRFGLNSTQRLLHSAHLQMEQLLDSTVYTLEQYLESSARLQLAQAHVKMERAKERVLKQLDYDSRLVQRRLFEEVLLEITLPCLTRQMDNKWKTELQQFEQYIFSDYSSFILVHNVYDDVLRNILSEEIVKVVQDSASKTSSSLLLDSCDLALSQYSLLGHTPPRSAPGSPAIHARGHHHRPAAALVVEGRSQTADVRPESESDHRADATCVDSGRQSPERRSALLPPALVATQQFDESKNTEPDRVRAGEPSTATEAAGSSDADAAGARDVDSPALSDSPDPATLVSSKAADVQAGCRQPATPGNCVSESERSSVPLSPVILVARHLESERSAVACIEQSSEEAQIRIDESPASPEAAVAQDVDPPADLEAAITDSTEASAVVSPHGADVPAGQDQPVMQEASDLSALLVTQQPDESERAEASCSKLTSEEVRIGAGEPSAATEAAVTLDVAEPDPSSEVETPSLDPPDEPLSASQQSAGDQAGSDQSGLPENHVSSDHSTTRVQTECGPSAVPDSTSNQIGLSEVISSIEFSSSAAESSGISLGSLSDAICCDSEETSVVQPEEQQRTDRAVYLTGEIKNNWLKEKLNEEEQKESSEKDGNEKTEVQREETEKDEKTKERGEEQIVVHTESEALDEGYRSSGSPAGSATTLTTAQKESEERLHEEEEKTDTERRSEREQDVDETTEKRDPAEEGEKKEKVEGEILQSSQPMKPQPESPPELPLDSVLAIRDLVIEITEVETVITPCPSSCNTP